MNHQPNRNEVIIPEIPSLHPLHPDYRSFWETQLERCRYGYWTVGGTYVPPALYYYVNFGTIKKQISPFVPSSKKYGRPDLRDLEWEFHYLYLIARGFSGFELDTEYSSLALLKNPDELDLFKDYYPNAFFNGKPKTYVDPYQYLSRKHSKTLGKPLFENPKKNLLFLGSRDLGKSYLVAGVIAHMFLFDNPPYEDGSPSEQVVGASVADKSRDLLKKAKDMIDLAPGGYETPTRAYPAPFSKQYFGSISVGNDLVAGYKKKLKGKWVEAGSRSTIKHRSFNENPFAAQGTRPDLLVIEEVGLCPEFRDIYLHTVDVLRRGVTKTGTLLAIGTGGDMEKGTLPVSEMFFDPEKYDFVPLPDVYENRSNPICYFVPATYSLDEFRNENGFVDHTKAKLKIEAIRNKKKTSRDLEQEIQYRPLVPSEMFLAKSSSIFPTAELRRRFTEVSLNPPAYEVVELMFDPSATSGVSYRPINAEPLLKFPDDTKDREGAVVIWEHPYVEYNEALKKHSVPPGAYIISCDPYKDDTPDGSSLAAIYVVKTSKYPSTVGFDQIVASYVGRPYLGKSAVNEILHKLALYYNARIYFENSVGNVKDYFEKVSRLDLLATQPLTLFNKKAASITTTLVYGYPMPNHRVKLEALQYLRNWLLTPRDEKTLNLDLIPDPALLSELISFTLEGNFDRVMSLVGAVIGLEEQNNLLKRRLYNEAELSSLDREIDRIFTNNKYLPKHAFTKSAITIL